MDSLQIEQQFIGRAPRLVSAPSRVLRSLGSGLSTVEVEFPEFGVCLETAQFIFGLSRLATIDGSHHVEGHEEVGLAKGVQNLTGPHLEEQGVVIGERTVVASIDGAKAARIIIRH